MSNSLSHNLWLSNFMRALDGLRDNYRTQLKEDPRIEVDESILKQFKDIATKKGITQKEALEQRAHPLGLL